jgi:hypothetical protein
MGHRAVAEQRTARTGAAPVLRRRPVPRVRGLNRFVPYLLLAVYFALGLTQVVAASITFDEGPHLAAGYTLVRTGDFRLQPIHIHPPLANVVAALPLLVQRDLPHPATVEGWEINSLSAITDAVVWQYPHPQRIAVAGRVPMLLTGVLLGALIFRWARDLRGYTAGTVALALFAFDPNLLAHGALITTDIAATALIVATLYTLYRSVDTGASRQRVTGRRPRCTRGLLLLGLLLGLAQLTKVSALALIPVVGALLFLSAAKSAARGWITVFLGRFALVSAVCAITLWAGYGFAVARPPGWSFALPAGVHVSIYQSLQEHYALGHATFAMGRVSSGGWWWYFPLAFALKTPLPVLILGGLCLAASWWPRGWCRRLSEVSPRLQRTFTGTRVWIGSRMRAATGPDLILLLFPLSYAAAAFFSTVNIGYRHLLPLLPFLYIGLGSGTMLLGRVFPRGSTGAQWFLPLLGVWLVAGTLNTLPYPLTFFNEIAGGPEGGYRYLVDSNLDWGQNLGDLKDWLAQHGRPSVAYAHYSPARPSTHGIEVTYLPPDPRAGAFAPWNPQPGLYAIGATVLQGPYAPDLNTYAWFRAREPVARLGHALFVYEVPAGQAPGWVVLCVPGMDHARLSALLGTNTLRVLQPNCEGAFVYPATEAPGLYVLPPDAPAPPESEPWLVLRHGDGTVAAYVVRVSSTGARPVIPARLSFQGPATFLGHTLIESEVRPGERVELVTYWRVNEIPARPLSLMAHLVAEDGSAVAVGDGLGFPIEQWREGDLMVQRHHWTLPQDLGLGTTLQVVTGAYWLDTMERWRAEDGSESVALQTVTVGN